MIKVKKLNDKEFVINSDLIETIEATPDTTITMTTGKKIISSDSVDEIINKIVIYKKNIYNR